VNVGSFFTSGQSWVGASRFIRQVGFPDVVPTMSPMTMTGANLGAEVNVPYYNERKFINTNRVYDNFINATSIQTFQWDKAYGETSVGKAVAYHSYGPDIRIAPFRQIPIISFRSTVSSYGLWVPTPV